MGGSVTGAGAVEWGPGVHVLRHAWADDLGLGVHTSSVKQWVYIQTGTSIKLSGARCSSCRAARRRGSRPGRLKHAGSAAAYCGGVLTYMRVREGVLNTCGASAAAALALGGSGGSWSGEPLSAALRAEVAGRGHTPTNSSSRYDR